MKKVISVFLATVILFAFVLCPLGASAIVTSYGGTLTALPGNTRSSSPVYNYAWLDNIIVRDDAMAVTSATLIPRPDDYQGSHTYDEFIVEAEQYTQLFDINENTVADAYRQVTDTMYYLVTAMGMTGELDEMRAYLQDYGIKLPEAENPDDKFSIAVTYAALKYDAVYTLYGKEAPIPVGTSLEGALVIILSALTDTMLPSGIDTFTGMAVNTAKTYVTQFEELPISANPEADEIFHWVKVITAATNDYQVPLAAYDVATEAQKDYVNYAYYATVLNTAYDVTLNPIYLVIATQSDDPLALQKLILQTMLDEKEVSYAFDLTAEELFELATEYGCFALEDEFYTDILTYELTVAEECEKIWFTPFVLAGQLEGGNDDYVSIVLGDTVMSHSSTVSTALNPALRQEEITMSVAYNDGVRNDSAVYKFIVNKDASLNSNEKEEGGNNLVSDVQDFVNNIVPTDNEKVSQIVDGVFNGIENQVGQAEDLLTTFGDGTDYTDVTVPSVHTTNSHNFEYLDELFAGVYATDVNGNIITTSSFFDYGSDENTDGSIIQTVTSAVKENPEIIIAPTSLLALGSLAGVFFKRKQRNSVLDSEDSEQEAE